MSLDAIGSVVEWPAHLGPNGWPLAHWGCDGESWRIFFKSIILLMLSHILALFRIPAHPHYCPGRPASALDYLDTIIRCLQLSIIDANHPDLPPDYISFSWSYVPPWYIPSPPLKRGQQFAGVGGIVWTFIPGHSLVWFMGGFLWNFLGLAPKGVPKMVNWQMLHLSSKDLSCLMTNSVTGKWEDE